ncbi:hypothetical protein CRM22_003384 [Opisthorchis felineus]|uniref:G-protein coupled receptors family 1 profile domain-containing protein n=1 Tax=Opisthorchis felineus TaxID=147828 RepID=A0A4V3SFX8_OPIFE|nr:hypothetical protein CRM22_003384 [Opisthorchis felineus]
MNQTLLFDFQMYHHVNYVGLCSSIANQSMYNQPGPQPHLENIVGLFVVHPIAIVLNLLALCVFFGHETGQQGYSAQQTVFSAESGNKDNFATLGRSSRNHKTSVSLSLLLLSLCECVLNTSSLIFMTLIVIGQSMITNTSPRLVIEAMPVLQNVFFYVADLGALTRNWCVCLITLARAEVILWPFGSGRFQRNLRSRRKFIKASLSILCIAVVLVYIKRADYVGMLCFSEPNNQYVMWSRSFILDEHARILFDAHCFYFIQGALPWVIILISTLLILAQLKPWCSSSENTGRYVLRSLTASQSMQLRALERRQHGQRRATNVVISIVVVFLPFQLTCYVISVLETLKVLDRNSDLVFKLDMLSNFLLVLNSICNFFIFFVTLKEFRFTIWQMCCGLWRGHQTSPPTHNTTREEAVRKARSLSV